jgi:NADP-dependent aldehyde dehydrogenase
MSKVNDVLIAGRWQPADASGTFQAINPANGETLPDTYPVSRRTDVDKVLVAGAQAAEAMVELPAAARAAFLECFADKIEARKDELVDVAHRETAYPTAPRLGAVELPRTSGQLRQAAAAATAGDWALPTIDTKLDVRSMLGPLGGAVAVFGPNNFPFAFNSVSGGDFAAAIAAGNPVVAKAHHSHPTTTRLLAEEAFAAVTETGLPPATVQLLYRMDRQDGLYFVGHPLLGATGYTGSRTAGLALKAAADAGGNPIYLELSSINPVFILPGALRERSEEILGELVTSALMGTGQFCTNPGVIVLRAGDESESFAEALRARFDAAVPGPLLNKEGLASLSGAVQALQASGAKLVTGGAPVAGPACCFQNTLLTASASAFIRDPEGLQREAFGNANLIVTAASDDEMVALAAKLEGNLTGCLYSHRDGDDDALYARVVRPLRRRVGRLLNDKMPTGVAVSPGMNHGGPYPATGHPGFTAVGIPASLRRFAMLECYDGVREARLPDALRNKNPNGQWRMIDGSWTQASVV